MLTSRLRDRIVGGVGAGLGGEGVPLAVQEHAEAGGGRGAAPGGGGHGELLAQGGQEGLAGQAVQVLDDAVVVHDLQLVVGERHGHEALEGLVAGGLGRGRPARLAVADGGGGAVVAVGDVQGRHGFEQVVEGVDVGLLVDDPDRVADAVLGDHVVDRRGGADLVHQGVDVGHGTVGQEHRLGVGGLLGDVAGAVVLLVLAGVLVALDEPVLGTP